MGTLIKLLLILKTRIKLGESYISSDFRVRHGQVVMASGWESEGSGF